MGRMAQRKMAGRSDTDAGRSRRDAGLRGHQWSLYPL